MDILYKCTCMTAEVSVAVPDRQKDEDIRDWMLKVGIAISADHQIRNPICGATSMEYAKIPMPENAPFIGGKPKMDS